MVIGVAPPAGQPEFRIMRLLPHPRIVLASLGNPPVPSSSQQDFRSSSLPRASWHGAAAAVLFVFSHKILLSLSLGRFHFFAPLKKKTLLLPRPYFLLVTATLFSSPLSPLTISGRSTPPAVISRLHRSSLLLLTRDHGTTTVHHILVNFRVFSILFF